MTVKVATFYIFTPLPGFAEIAADLKRFCGDHTELRGTILVAAEGVNGTVSGNDSDMAAFAQWVADNDPIAAMALRFTTAEEKPFKRMKVKVKDEIVTTGVDELKTAEGQVRAKHVKPADWDKLISDPNVLTVDTRNDYEYKIGTFAGAVNPATDAFRDFAEYADTELAGNEDKPIAMFCTGGIRCEKASAYLKSKGFENVYQLEGGILNYLNSNVEQPNDSSFSWEGECYVFDDRVTLSSDLTQGNYTKCLGCGMPLSETDKDHKLYEPGVCCHHCAAELTATKRAKMQMKLDQQTSDPNYGAPR